MVLNAHFALKYVSDLASNGMAFWLSDNCSEICRPKHILSAQKCSEETLVSVDISFMRLFTGLGFIEEGASNRTVFTALTHAVH